MTHDEPRMMNWLGDLANGSIAREDFVQLCDAMSADDEAVDAYLRYMTIHAGLIVRSASPIGAVEVSGERPPIARVGLKDVRNEPRPGRAATWPAIAAALLVAGAVVVVVMMILRNATPPPHKSDRPVATLIQADTTVLVGDTIANPGDDYAAGTFRIGSGSAEFLLTSNATVTLRGDTQLTMIGDMHAVLDRGSATFDCPASAVGFTVDLPDGTRVVDLGTRFTVHTSDVAPPSVLVAKGRVKIETAVGPTEVRAPSLAVVGADGSVDVSMTIVEDFDADELDEQWAWDSPGKAKHALLERAGWLRMNVPAMHNAWVERGLAPIAYRREPLPARYSIETEMELIDVKAGVGGVALYDPSSGHFALSIGLLGGAGKRIIRLESPGVQFAEVAYDGARVVLRLTRTEAGGWIGEYRAPDEDEWHTLGRAGVAGVPGEASQFRAALLTKAWDEWPTTIDYEYFHVTGEIDPPPTDSDGPATRTE